MINWEMVRPGRRLDLWGPVMRLPMRTPKKEPPITTVVAVLV